MKLPPANLTSLFPRLAVCLLMAAVLIPTEPAHGQDYKAILMRLTEAVQQGEITKHQAGVMLEALKKDAAQGDKEARNGDELDIWFEWVEKVGGELKEAVEQGDLSEKEAWGKWKYFLGQELAPKLKAAVKEGDLSKKQAWRIWKEVAGADTKEKEIKKHEAADNDKDTAKQSRMTKAEWKAAKISIEAKVKAGRMSREKADKLYEIVDSYMGWDKHRIRDRHEFAEE